MLPARHRVCVRRARILQGVPGRERCTHQFASSFLERRRQCRPQRGTSTRTTCACLRRPSLLRGSHDRYGRIPRG
nr:unnamed protein product [Callosobruchus chinensis]